MTRTAPILFVQIAFVALPTLVFAADPEDEIRALAIEFNDAHL